MKENITFIELILLAKVGGTSAHTDLWKQFCKYIESCASAYLPKNKEGREATKDIRQDFYKSKFNGVIKNFQIDTETLDEIEVTAEEKNAKVFLKFKQYLRISVLNCTKDYLNKQKKIAEAIEDMRIEPIIADQIEREKFTFSPQIIYSKLHNSLKNKEWKTDDSKYIFKKMTWDFFLQDKPFIHKVFIFTEYISPEAKTVSLQEKYKELLGEKINLI